MNLFLIYFIVSIVASLAWTFFVLRANEPKRQSLGLAGAWAATLVLATLWQAETLPWLWSFLQVVLLVWLGAMTMQAMAVATLWNTKQPPFQLPLVTCAVISMIVNLAAGLHFLWIATASSAGV